MMALILAIGFVVDDAIVMLENIVRHIEAGVPPFEAALQGSKEIGFTIVSMTVSLAAVFIPILFMGGILGRLFREFAVTITVAILISGLVSITLTPMLCSRFLRQHDPAKKHNLLYRDHGMVLQAPVPDLRVDPGARAESASVDAGGILRGDRTHLVPFSDRAQGIHSGSGHRSNLRYR